MLRLYPRSGASRHRKKWLLAALFIAALPVRAEEPYGKEPNPQTPPPSQEKPRGDNEALHRQITQKLRYAMASVGIDDTAVQDALLQYIREEEQSKRALRNSSKQLALALQRAENPDKIPGLIASHKQEMDTYRSRRELAQKTLDEKIRFSTTPQLEASLILIGVLGDGPPALLGNVGGPNGANQSQQNRGAANTAVDAQRPTFVAPGGQSSLFSGTGQPGGVPAGFGPRPALAARTGADSPVVEPENGATSTPGTVARENGEARNSLGTANPRRAVPSSLRGSTTGTVDKKGMDYVEILAEDGTLERYTPRWLGGAQGGFDSKIIQAIGAFGIGDRVTVEWEYAERKRIFSIVAAPLPKENKK